MAEMNKTVWSSVEIAAPATTATTAEATVTAAEAATMSDWTVTVSLPFPSATFFSSSNLITPDLRGWRLDLHSRGGCVWRLLLSCLAHKGLISNVLLSKSTAASFAMASWCSPSNGRGERKRLRRGLRS
ncbi:hypothetical protein DEO72_LG3g1756 [Vigna unguiculata]|uniref:Uncharacterized protein n=1 Tax=Vigna unguiculata TaxID=3917 RepID=A0A4D6LF42_VIGUN|nr:hypothetical protein DEO72_LG3g1756 [Vigna unguiculata]